VKYLIAGLGNIGAEYDHTRHNIGFDVLDHLARLHNTVFNLDRLAYAAEIKLKGRSVWLIKPTTYMNLSGKAIQYWMQKLHIPKENVLVITDDLSLPVGKLRFRPSGSDGGHNGLKSISMHLEGNEYPRMRFGIGNNFPKGRQVDFVLGKWDIDDQIVVNSKMDDCAKAIESFVLAGLNITMNQYNK
jgi:PTH1 family peptidyl-tRNA hydrolase